MKQGWEIRPFEKCIEKVKYTTKIATCDYSTMGAYPVVSQEEEYISGYWNNAEDVFKVSKPVVIFGDHTRVLKYVDFDFVLGADGVKILQPIDAINAKFFLYYLIASNIPSLGYSRHYKLLKELNVPVPPIAEQEKIVAELDCLSGIIEKKKQQLKELDALAQSIFYEMFGDPVENDKRWDVKRIEDICDVYRGGSPRPIDKFLGGNIPWIKIGDATLGDSIFLTQTKEHIIEEGLRKTRFIHSGSLIFANCGGSLGFARIITFDGCIHDGWLAFDNVSEEIDKIFFLKSLNFCTPYFRSIAPDGVQPNLNTSIMKAFKQILPPLSMQKDYVDKIQAIEKQELLVTESLVQAEMLLNSRMDYYFN